MQLMLFEDADDEAGGLARSLGREMDNLWTFLEEQGVEPINNRAERALRLGVLWRKRSKGTQSEKGNRWIRYCINELLKGERMYLHELSIKNSLFHLFCMIMANLFLLPMLTNADTQVKRQITVGHTETELLVGVNYDDAQAAAKFFFENPALKQILEFDPQIIFSNLETMVKGINSGEIDAVTMLPISYLKVKDQLNAEPFAVPLYDGKIESSYVLLVLKSKNISKIDQLRNKRLIIEKGLGGYFAGLWADTLLFEKNLPESAIFFKTILSVDKPSSAALPVFFGQSDACIIRKNSYELLAELNPQINEKLKILHESKPFLNAIILMRKDLSVDLKEMVIKFSQEIHKLHGAKQLLMMLHASQVLPYKPEYLKNIENLYKKYQAGKKDPNESNTQIHLDTP